MCLVCVVSVCVLYVCGVWCVCVCGVYVCGVSLCVWVCVCVFVSERGCVDECVCW